jgi:thioredoxin reductase
VLFAEVMAEALGVSGIVPSTDFDATTSSSSSESERSTSETESKIEASRDHSKQLGRNHKSIHIKSTPVHTVKPTVIATTYASFKLQVSGTREML